MPKKPDVKRALKGDAAVDPVSDSALRAQPVSYADAPDLPIVIQVGEIASLARLAKAAQARLTKVGIGPDTTNQLARFGRRLVALENTWQAARGEVHLSAAEQKLRTEAEALDNKLVEGGRWGCRKDPAALTEIARIAEGSGLADTVQDLRDGVTFWAAHKAQRAATDVTDADLARATKLADLLEGAAAKESADVDAASALELRNRCFWAANVLATDVRLGGRYAFREQPKIAAKFVSRHRAEAARRSRRKPKPAPAKAPA